MIQRVAQLRLELTAKLARDPTAGDPAGGRHGEGGSSERLAVEARYQEQGSVGLAHVCSRQPNFSEPHVEVHHAYRRRGEERGVGVEHGPFGGP